MLYIKFFSALKLDSKVDYIVNSIQGNYYKNVIYFNILFIFRLHFDV